MKDPTRFAPTTNTPTMQGVQTSLGNSIMCGDCADKLRHIASESVDLIYMDPPFFSGKDYDDIWKDGAALRSFQDTKFYKKVCVCGKDFPQNYLFCPQCGASVDEAKDVRMNDIEAYVGWLKVRLQECYRVLKPTGSIYVHLDWHAIHYIKVAMDEIFGYGNFRNEIVWHYKSVSNVKNDFARKHDNILRYIKGKKYTFNMDDVREPYDEKTVKRYKTPVKFPGGYKAKMNEKGKAPDDVWVIPPIRNVSKERLGYPTQKPEALLERIIKASSNPADLVLDPFCGCGTSITVAQKLGRRWIGIDVSPTSCETMVDRLRATGYNIGHNDIIDMPQTNKELRNMNPQEFENWAVVNKLGGTRTGKAGDRGIDGWTGVAPPMGLPPVIPIQIKQSEKVGNPVVRLFAQDIRDVDKKEGVIVALSYSSGAHDEVDHIWAKYGIKIKLMTVADLVD